MACFFFTSLFPLLFLPATYDALLLLLLLLPPSPSIVFAESSFQKKEFLAVVVVVALTSFSGASLLGSRPAHLHQNSLLIKNHGKFKFITSWGILHRISFCFASLPSFTIPYIVCPDNFIIQQ